MKSTIRQDRALVRLSLSNRRLTSSDLSKEWRQSAGVEVSTSTIRKRLLQSGLRGCKAKKKPKVSEKQRKARIAWAKEHLNWTSEDWDKVILVMKAPLLSKIMWETTLFEEDLMKRLALSAFCLLSSIRLV